MVVLRVTPGKATEDAREYRTFKLANGLKVALISDPTTDKAGAALDVHVGHLSDPWEIPGLAHFLEHMLFLGTEKYPDENEYSQFLSLHGGSSNAYTGTDHTNFYFDVSPQFLPGALDRFAQFFLHPLFTESATDREMKAVNSENEKNLASDAWRVMQLERFLSKSGHDYKKFGTGNTDTLDKVPKSKGINVRDALLDFHKKWYSANIMALAVLGNQTLDELEALVLEHFNEVVSTDVTIPSWEEHPYSPETLMVHMLPIKDMRQLNMSFPIPDYSEHYLSKPVSYLSHLIGHEGKGSLLSELKALGYVNNLVAGHKAGAKGFDFFIVDVDLTETGIENTDQIIKLIFQYLSMLRQQGIQEWVFQECKDINSMLFRFKDKERPMNYVRTMATRLHEYPLEDVLTGPWIMKDWNPSLITDILEKCLVPEKAYVIVIGQKFAELTTETEEWYGTKYHKAQVCAEKVQEWSSVPPNDRLHLPDKNEFIPTDFDLVERDTKHSVGATVPCILHETPLSRLWFLQDTEFLLPKAAISIEMTSPFAYVDPHHANLTSMYVKVFQDALTEYSYEAELAGLWYDLSPTRYGITLSVRGYHQKQGVLLEKIITMMRSFKVDKKRFDVLKEAFVRALKNFEMEQPHTHASYGAQVLLTERIWTKEELLKSATDDNLSAEALQLFLDELLGRLHIEMFVHGNLTPEKALEMLTMIEKKLGDRTQPLPSHACVRSRQTQLPLCAPFYHQTENAIHKSSCILTVLQVGMDSTKSNMLLELFSQIIKESFFNVLRTKEQLGYIVYSGVRSGAVRGLQFIIQSHRKPTFLDKRIEAFIKSTRDTIQEMSDEEFNRHKQALSDKRLEKPKKLSARNARIWSEISAQSFNFNRVNVEVELLSNLERKDVLDFYDDCIGLDAKNRRKLSTHVVSSVPADESEEGQENAKSDEDVDVSQCGQQIIDIRAFKGSLPLFPLVQPFVDLKDLRRC